LPAILERRKEEARVPSIKRFMIQNPIITAGMGHAALVVEGSVLLGIVWPRLRPPLLLSMALFHIGIAAVMPPVFYNQALSYLVMVDWQQHLIGSPPLPLILVQDLSMPTQCFLYGLVGALTLVLALSTVITPFEFWPLSECGFYSAGVEVVEKRLTVSSRNALEGMLMNRNTRNKGDSLPKVAGSLAT